MRGELRKESNCLNCGATVMGRYCSECGQENREPRESFGELLYHFFSDFTHFDSKFFTTIKDLIIHPGFLTKEYLSGKRMRYLHPIRMYIFISFLFFIILGFLKKDSFKSPTVETEFTHNNAKAIQALKRTIDSLKASGNPADSAGISSLQKQMAILTLSEEKKMTAEEFDSIQQALPPSQKPTGIEGFLIRRFARGKANYGPQYYQVMYEKFMHDIPKAMFFLLPLFALFIKWFYRKGHYYSDHAIFSLHFHSFIFLAMLVVFLLDKIFKIQFFETYIIWVLFIYLVMALKNVYKKSLLRSFFKAIWISIFYGLSIFIVMGIVGAIVFSTI